MDPAELFRTSVSGDLDRRDAAILNLRGKFGVLVREDSGIGQLLHLVAYLAMLGPVKVLDAGNHFDTIKVAYAIRRVTSDLYTATERTYIVRSFTCIEAVKALQQMEAGAPVIIIDLLATFYDDAVSDRRSTILVQECINQIRRLKAGGPVVASARQGAAKGSPRVELFSQLIAAADLVETEPAPDLSQQARMF
jgi:hypothetical protein